MWAVAAIPTCDATKSSCIPQRGLGTPDYPFRSCDFITSVFWECEIFGYSGVLCAFVESARLRTAMEKRFSILGSEAYYSYRRASKPSCITAPMDACDVAPEQASGHYMFFLPPMGTVLPSSQCRTSQINGKRQSDPTPRQNPERGCESPLGNELALIL